MRKLITVLSIGLIFLSSIACISNEKIIYLQNLEDNQAIPEGELISYEIPEYKLQYNDIFDVNFQMLGELTLNGKLEM